MLKSFVRRSIDAGLVKKFRKEYKDNLDHNQKHLVKGLNNNIPFMQNEWKGYEQVSNDKMLLKVDTAYTKEGLTQVANAVCNLPEDKSLSAKILINDRKTMF
jgi:2-oxoglutarate dehydrogenase E1 component